MPANSGGFAPGAKDTCIAHKNTKKKGYAERQKAEGNKGNTQEGHEARGFSGYVNRDDERHPVVTGSSHLKDDDQEEEEG